MTTVAEALQEVADAQEPDLRPLIVPLFDRAIASSFNRQEWLRARQRVATATEVAELRRHGVAFRRELVAKKLQPPVEIVGNRYIDRGHEREPVIAAFVARLWPRVRGNDVLLSAAENERHAATPDLLGVVDGELVCGDIKTSKYDLRPSRRDGYFWSTHYYGQLQWQMYVTGTRRALFVWERHDDAWPSPQPLELEPEWEWVDRDDAEIGRMVATADLMLADLDLALAALAEGDPVEPELVDEPMALEPPAPEEDVVDAEVEPEPVDAALELRREVTGLGLAVLSAREAETEVAARKQAPWTKLQALLASSPSDAWEDGQVKVSWTNETQTESVADPEAALAAPVEGFEDVTGNDLKADLERAQAAWEAHLAHFRKDRSVSKQRLTVTAVKPKKGAKG